MKTFADIVLEKATKFDLWVTAQKVDSDYALIDSIRKALGPAITQEVGAILNSRAVSSIEIRVNWTKPKATFVVNAVGSDKDSVAQEVVSLLNKKYAAKVAAMLAKVPESFEFGLLTVQ